MTKNGGGFEDDAYTGLSDVGRIQLVFGAIIVIIITLVLVVGGIASKNPFLVIGGLLFGGFCLWLQYTMYHSKALSAVDGGFMFLRLL